MSSFTCKRKISVPDELITGDTQITLESLVDGMAFECSGILIGSSSDADEEDLGYATIKGVLVGETDVSVDTYKLATKTAQPFEFKKIWTSGTTARGIKFLGEK